MGFDDDLSGVRKTSLDNLSNVVIDQKIFGLATFFFQFYANEASNVSAFFRLPDIVFCTVNAR